ncbi:MAG TPA: hypothetical protein VFA18_02915 [Gemmataceae bacterium]|nr:hypothetical protein [Gemmataceae bacterium]
MIPTIDAATPRRFVYGILIALAVGAVAGKILAVQRLYEPALFRPDPNDTSDQRSAWPKYRPEPEPSLGDNDRSRWATARALVDNGTYAIGYRDNESEHNYHDSGIIAEDGWKTIDKVLLNRDGQRTFYSSKPPFLATLVAGEYWVLKHGFGLSIIRDRWVVMRIILLTINGIPFVIYLVLLSRLLERYGTTDWGRYLVLAAAGVGTLVLPFMITLNNHILAAFAVLFALYPVLKIWSAYRAGTDNGRALHAGYFLLAGFFAAVAACMELPALSLAAALLVLLFWLAPLRTLALFVPAAAIPAAAFFLTNYQAIGKLTPAYAEFGGPAYQYAGSHWKPPESGQVQHGIDFAHESKPVYAMHMLVGHHGFFSLTPIFLPALVGLGAAFVIRRRSAGKLSAEPGFPVRDSGLLGTMLLTVLLSVVVIGFYIYKSNNYGGWTSGMRWLIWLTPLWLLSLLPAADWLSVRRWGRGLAYLLLAVSVLSAHYPPWNPWRHPWLYNLLAWAGLVRY